MPFVLALVDPQSEPAGPSPLRKVLPGALMSALHQQIDSAISEVKLAGDATTTDKAAAEAVHEARKAIKRIRAMLRLLHRGLGRKTAKAASQDFAQVARSLAESRESQAMQDALRELGRSAAAPPAPPAGELDHGAAVAAARSAQKARTRADATRLSPRVRDEALHALQAAQHRVASWSLRKKPKRLVRCGLRRAVRRAHQTVAALSKAVSEAQTIIKLHELRKRVKDLYYMASLLSPADPVYLDELASRLDQLADLLGDDHDLALLAEKAHASPHEFGGSAAVTTLLSLVAHRQRALRAAAGPLTAALPKLSPRAFARRIVRGLQQHLH